MQRHPLAYLHLFHPQHNRPAVEGVTSACMVYIKCMQRQRRTAMAVPHALQLCGLAYAHLGRKCMHKVHQQPLRRNACRPGCAMGNIMGPEQLDLQPRIKNEGQERGTDQLNAPLLVVHRHALNSGRMQLQPGACINHREGMEAASTTGNGGLPRSWARNRVLFFNAA